MCKEPSSFPSLSELRQDFLKSWSGEARFGPGHHVTIMYVGSENPESLSNVKAALAAIVDRVFNEESHYRLKAAEAWLPSFHEESEFQHLSAEDIASVFVLVGIIAGDHDPGTIILEHRGPSNKPLKSWFNTDGSLHHISGHIAE